MRTVSPTGPAWEKGLEMRLGQAARTRPLPSPLLAGRAPGGAAPPRPRAAQQLQRPPLKKPRAPPPGRGRPRSPLYPLRTHLHEGNEI
ncbi:Protocadherin-23 [Manis pentadactyla]|nr:Protocadherin-23 [Manis pentadactyla]